MQQQHFFLTYQAKGSLRNDRQYDSIPQYPLPPPPQKESLMQPPGKFGQCTTILQSPLSFKFTFISNYFDAIIQAWKLLGVHSVLFNFNSFYCMSNFILSDLFFCTARPFTERIYEEKKMREEKVDWNVSKMKIPTLISFNPQFI